MSITDIPPIDPLILTIDADGTTASTADIIEHVLADPVRRTEVLRALLPKNGDHVTWEHTARGGYGYATPVPALVIETKAKVRITVDRNGKEELVTRDVDLANVRFR